MYEILLATFIFWCAFVFSAGPFWIDTMEAAPGMPFPEMYKNYVLYLIFGWLPVLVTSSLLSNVIASLVPRIFIAMHLLGGTYVIYLAYKVLRSKIKTGEPFKFDWKAMSMVSYLNPKVWILVPVGFLTARLTGQIHLDIAFFYFSGIPIFLFGVFFWGTIGRVGAKISLQYISYLNAALLAMFGAFLIQAGIGLM